MKEFKLSEQFVYYEASDHLILASLDPEDDFFLKISGPALRVIPLVERGATYEGIATRLLAEFEVLDRKIVDANLPKMLDYLVDNSMVLASTGRKRASSPEPSL